ncbi:tyrosine-type recombinase/integrase [Sporosarcina contaminans]|uniref:Tyrosine-type recombinase/integrase n=1 Tax=Sporosarcina contaminans TaxID=633403 RepID=A0ABW3U270_9BACL
MQDHRNLTRVMKRILDSLNVPRIRFHDLRHSHASILISEGVDVVRISDQLGHSNPEITLDYYAHLLPNTNDGVADIFHNALQIPSNHPEEEGNKKK